MVAGIKWSLAIGQELKRELMSNVEPYSTTVESYCATEVILRIRRQNSFVYALVLGIPAMLGCLLSVGMFYYSLSQIGANDAKGPAPDADFATRRAWGESELKHHFRRAEQWVRKSEQITQDVGLVTGVAPIGGPNCFNSYWAESDASLNLQVIGRNGEGILCLPDVCADHPEYIFGLERDSTWTFNGKSSPLVAQKWER